MPAVAPPPKDEAPALKKRMTLSNITRGRLERPMRIMIYGVEGVGKSSFASHAPGVIFLGAEDGTTQLDVTRFPEPRTWLEALEALEALTAEEHPYQTLAIDTLDWLEPLCWAHLYATRRTKNGKRAESILDYGFGDGYKAALDVWRTFVAALERLRAARSMHVITIAHSHIKRINNPEGDDYDRYQPKLHELAAGLFGEWSDAVLFATHETLTHETNGRTKGIASGARIIYTEYKAAYVAKNRYDLPPRLPLDWDAFMQAVQAHAPADPGVLATRIGELLAGVTDADLAGRVRAAVAGAGEDAAKLARILNRLTATVADGGAPKTTTQTKETPT
jgi:AAA domain